MKKMLKLLAVALAFVFLAGSLAFAGPEGDNTKGGKKKGHAFGHHKQGKRRQLGKKFHERFGKGRREGEHRGRGLKIGKRRKIRKLLKLLRRHPKLARKFLEKHPQLLEKIKNRRRKFARNHPEAARRLKERWQKRRCPSKEGKHGKKKWLRRRCQKAQEKGVSREQIRKRIQEARKKLGKKRAPQGRVRGKK